MVGVAGELWEEGNGDNYTWTTIKNVKKRHLITDEHKDLSRIKIVLSLIKKWKLVKI